MRTSPILAAALTLSAISLHADSSPALQWVQALGGSGVNSVAGAAADSHGNFYIAGNTASLDFPVTAALQRAPGGSTLARIDTATGAWQRLYPPGLSNASQLAADPRNPKTLYAAAANAVWRSADAGGTWAMLSQLPSGVTVNALAVDPASGTTLYAGTYPQGVFKSTDGGLTWTAGNNGIPTEFYGQVSVNYLAVDPKVPQVVFALATTGLVRSADGGATWALVPSWTQYSSVFNELVFDPFSPGTVYLAAGYAILKSTDDGQTFTLLYSPPLYSASMTLAADPFHAGVLFAGFSYLGVFESSDSGVTWTQKSTQPACLLTADPNRPAFYSYCPSYGIAESSDGFTTSSPIGPPETSLVQLVVAGSNLFPVAAASDDVFVVKLDPGGKVVYSTYFGGSADDAASAMAAGADGSVYVTGSTLSPDFPVTAGAYMTSPTPSAIPVPHPFVFKLNPDGSLAWSTYFADQKSTPTAIAVDSSGNPYVATSVPGPCIEIYPVGCLPGPALAFVTKLSAKGTGLIYSTQAFTYDSYGVVYGPQALAIDPSGNTYVAANGTVALLNATGTAVLASTEVNGLAITALALDSNLNLYATGSWTNYETGSGFPSTSGAFQTRPQPAVPLVPGEVPGGADAFVVKWDGGLSRILAATLLGGESADEGASIAIDASGIVIVSGYTDSQAFPTHAPFQTSFSARAGFVAGLDSNLAQLLFSTYLGDGHPFAARAAVPDGSGGILLAGITLSSGSVFIGSDPGASDAVGALVVANRIALPPAPGARLDSVVNFASRMAAPLAPGETIAAIGAGFGTGSQLLVDGVPLAPISRTATTLVGVLPDGAKTNGAFQIQVLSGSLLSSATSLSNSVLVPAASASPGLYSLDGSGYGQGYILNSDGTLNSPSNPAAPGSAITILATGVGAYTLSGPYAVTALMAAVFVDDFYANGIAAVMTPVAGLPGNVYQIGVVVPSPGGIVMPSQVRVRMAMGTVNGSNPDNSTLLSQPGIVLNVRQ